MTNRHRVLTCRPKKGEKIHRSIFTTNRNSVIGINTLYDEDDILIDNNEMRKTAKTLRHIHIASAISPQTWRLQLAELLAIGSENGHFYKSGGSSAVR